MESKKHKYQDELKEIAPKLSEIERKEPFSVHDNYFEELSTRISDEISIANEEREAWSPALFRYLTASAFSFLILAFVFIYVNKKENNTTELAEIEITAEDLITSTYLSAIDEYYISETVAGSDADLNNFYVDNSEFENYLLDQGIDETLINEL